MMPEMDGYDVCRNIRANPVVADIPVLMLTALSDYRSRLRGFEAGVDDYITKPYDSMELFARVRTVSQLNRYKRLLTERAKFQQLFDLSPNGQALLDQKFEIRLANDAMARMLNLTDPKELVGVYLLDWIREDCKEAIQTLMLAIWNDLKQQRLETWLVGKEGLIQPAEVFLSRLDLGGQDMVHLIAIDIREKLKITGALAKERNILKAFLEMTPDLFYCKDLASKYILANPALAALTGQSDPDQLMGKTDFEFFPRELALRYFTDEQAMLQISKAIEGQEEPSIDSQGKRHTLLTTKRPLKNHRGEVMGLIGIGRDITEQRNTLAQLGALREGQAGQARQVQELKAKLDETSLQGAQFLLAACGKLEGALEGLTAAPPAQPGVETTADQPEITEAPDDPVFEIRLLLGELKDYAAYQTGDFRVEKQEIDVRKCVENVFRWSRRLAVQRRLDLRVKLALDLPEKLYGDCSLLSGVLYNYFQYALTQAQQGEVVALLELENNHSRPAPRDTSLHFTIRYTGQHPGGSGVEIQADEKGIGLMLGRRLAEAAGGAVWAEHKGEKAEEETVLHFTFPVVMP
jgi:PAS domain S-box-containing protein